MDYFDSNPFRPDIPDGVSGISQELADYLTSQAAALRGLFYSAATNTLLIPAADLTLRSEIQLYPLGAQATTVLTAGKLTHLMYVQHESTDVTIPRLVFWEDLYKVGDSGLFAGVDYAEPGAGRFGWIVVQGPCEFAAPAPTEFPAYYGAVAGELSLTSLDVVARRLTKHSQLEILGGVHNRGMIESQSVDVLGMLENAQAAIADLQAQVADFVDLDVQVLSESIDQVNLAMTQIGLQVSQAESAANRAVFVGEALSRVQRDVEAKATATSLALEAAQTESGKAALSQVDAKNSADASYYNRSLAGVYADNSRVYSEASQLSMIEATASSTYSQAQASVSSYQAVRASESATVAMTAVSVIAGIGTSVLNANAGFDVWADPGTSPPENWDLDSTLPPIFSRIPGYNSNYAIRLERPENNSVMRGMSSSLSGPDITGPGWYVVDFAFRLEAGEFPLNTRCRFVLWGFDEAEVAQEAAAWYPYQLDNGTGGTIGVGEVGRIYRFSKLAQIDDPDVVTHKVRFVLDGADYGSHMTPGWVVSVDYLGYRAASDAEIATQTVLTDVVSSVAAVESEVTAHATLLDSHASSIFTLTTNYGTLSGTVGGHTTALGTHTSQISSLTSALGAAVTDIDSLEASYSSLNATVGGHTTVLGTHTSQISSLVSDVDSLVTDVTDLSSSFDSLSGTVAGHTSSLSTVNSTLSAHTTNIGANSAAITTLGSNYSALNSTVGGHTTSIGSINSTLTTQAGVNSAQASLNPTLKAQVGIGGNLLRNSRFNNNSYAGWGAYAEPGESFDFAVNGGGVEWLPDYENSLVIHQLGTAHKLSQFFTDPIPVIPGTYYAGSAWVAAHRCNLSLLIFWYDSADAYISGAGLIDSAVSTGGTYLSQFNRVWTGAKQAPANARYARFVLEKERTLTGADSWAWMTRPMFCKVTADTTVIPEFSHALPDAQINEIYSVTASHESGIDALKAKYTLTLNVDGAITGIELLGGGGNSEFTVLADEFKVKTSSGSQTPFSVTGDQVRLGTDLYAGNHRVIFDNGVAKLVHGVGFGSANQFIEWFGPSMAISSMTEANAVTYKKTNGDALTRGSLIVGDISNQLRTTSLSATAEVDLGTVASAGGNRVIVVSYVGETSGDGTWPPIPSLTAAMTATVVLERANGAGWDNIGTLNVSGTDYTVEVDSFGGTWHAEEQFGGSMTVTDTTGGTSVRYRARITARSPTSLSSGGTLPVVWQTLSIAESEDV